MEELLKKSLEDLKNTFLGKELQWEETSLAAAINQLANQNITIDFTSQGSTYELDHIQTEALFRLCQESMTNAIKHGKADFIHIILRYKPDEIELFAIDNGKGCQVIKKSYGLLGIEARIQKLGGKVLFGSDGKQGFTVHATLPRDYLQEDAK
jgi:signal transduction histidine kinase